MWPLGKGAKRSSGPKSKRVRLTQKAGERHTKQSGRGVATCPLLSQLFAAPPLFSCQSLSWRQGPPLADKFIPQQSPGLLTFLSDLVNRTCFEFSLNSQREAASQAGYISTRDLFFSHPAFLTFCRSPSSYLLFSFLLSFSFLLLPLFLSLPAPRSSAPLFFPPLSPSPPPFLLLILTPFQNAFLTW